MMTACGLAEAPPAETVTVPPATTPDLNAGAPPPPPPTAFIAQLTPTQTAAIDAIGAPLVVPTAIPPGFAVAQVNTSQEGAFASYQIVYRDDRDRCFAIEYAAGGIGGLPPTEARLPISLPIVNDAADYGLNYGHYADPTQRAQFPEPVMMSDWLPITSGFYRLAGAAYLNAAIQPVPPCQDVAAEEAMAIIESWVLISDDIQGEGDL